MAALHSAHVRRAVSRRRVDRGPQPRNALRRAHSRACLAPVPAVLCTAYLPVLWLAACLPAARAKPHSLFSEDLPAVQPRCVIRRALDAARLLLLFAGGLPACLPARLSGDALLRASLQALYSIVRLFPHYQQWHCTASRNLQPLCLFPAPPAASTPSSHLAPLSLSKPGQLCSASFGGLHLFVLLEATGLPTAIWIS